MPGSTPENGDSPNAPVLIQDRVLSGVVTHLALCPRMDLVAIVIERITIAILRTNWQRLATFPVSLDDKHVITAIEWSPDAAHLAVCTSKPLISIYSVDRCAATRGPASNRAARDTDPIATVKLDTIGTALSWMPAPRSSACLYRDRASALESKNSTALDSTSALLAIGGIDGMVTIFDISLRFVVAKLQVFSQGTRVGRLHLTPDFHHCFAVGYGSNSNAVGTNARPCSSVSLRTVDLRFLQTHWGEVDHVARAAIAFAAADEKLKSDLDIIHEVWITQALPSLVSTISVPLQKLMSDFAEENPARSPWHALYDVFCGAKMKGSVLQFLATELSENGAKEALRSFRGYVYDIEERIVQMLPFAERLLFRAAEFRGVARLTERFGPVGIEVENAQAIYEATEVLYQKIAEFTHEVEKSCNQIEALLAWLVLAAARAGGESLQGREEFDVSDGTNHDQDLIIEFFEKVTAEDALNMDPGDVDVSKDLLVNQMIPALHLLRETAEAAFDYPQKAISSSIAIKGGICLPFSLSSSTFQRKDPIWNKPTIDKKRDNELFTTLVSNEGILVNVKCNLDDSKWFVTCSSLRNDELQLRDAVMINDDQFLLAYEVKAKASDNGEDSVSQVLSLFETKPERSSTEATPIVTSSDDMIVVDLPNHSVLDGKHVTHSVTKQGGGSKELHVSVNFKLQKAR